MSVRVGVWTGLDSIRQTIVQAGLSRNPPRFPSLCLGAFESNLKDLTAAYTTFANGGVKLQPYLIERIYRSGRPRNLQGHPREARRRETGSCQAHCRLDAGSRHTRDGGAR